MEVEADRLISLETLCARMRLLLDLFGHEGALQGEAWWLRAANLLFPAACVTRVETDASVADLYDSGAYCSPSAAYDERQSRMLDDYMSSLARYHFVWNAYEMARSESAAGALMTSKYAGGRRTLAERVPPAQLGLLDRIYAASLSLAEESRKIRHRLEGKQVEQLGVGKAGRLAGAFRNHVFHGDEEPPVPDDRDDRFQRALDGAEVVSLQSYRMVSFTRLTLQLVQVLTHGELRPGVDIEMGHVPFLSRNSDCEFDVPCGFVLSLANCWPEERSLVLSPGAIEELAKGCGVSREVVELVKEVATGDA